jgi:hypothetical protein
MKKDPGGLEPATVDEPQPLDDAGAPALERMHSRRVGLRMATSVPGAIAGALLITALAFGAATRLTASTTGSEGATASETGAEGATGETVTGDTGDADQGAEQGADDPATEPVTEPKDDPATEPVTEPTDQPAADEPTEPAETPKTEPTDKPEPAEPATPGSISIALRMSEGRVTISWGSCERDGFVVWKVVRSLDGKPSWPLGSGDKLVAASENADLSSVSNGDLPAGKTVFYRVYALVERNGERVVGCVSRIADIRIPAAEPDPTPKPVEIGTLSLTVSLGDGKPVVNWGDCSGDWDLYKVVRSTNSTVSWPKGDGDSLAAVVGKDGETKVRDADAPAGKTVWYRVFCVRETETGYMVVAASAAKAIEVPAAEPQPEPDAVSLDFQVEITDGASVALHWGACSHDSFVAYKVLRSEGSNPSYLPSTDGTQVRSAIENAELTSYADGDVASGQTWTYRVQCIGYMNGHKILLGETAAKAVTLP